MECTRCGRFHDDGTADYCIYCLDELAEKNKKAPEDVQELTEPKHLVCIICGKSRDDNITGLCPDCLFDIQYGDWRDDVPEPEEATNSDEYLSMIFTELF